MNEEIDRLKIQLKHVEEILNNVLSTRPKDGSEKGILHAAHVLLNRLQFWKENPDEVHKDGDLRIGVPSIFDRYTKEIDQLKILKNYLKQILDHGGVMSDDRSGRWYIIPHELRSKAEDALREYGCRSKE